MSKQLGTPRVGQPIGSVKEQGGGLVALCNLWLQQQLRYLGRNPVATPSAVVVGASPFTYLNDDDFDVDVVVNGGTVSAVAFTRDGTTFFTTATATNNTVRLNPGDSVRVTYTVAPNLTLIPR